METGELLQCQHALLETQSGFLELNVISSIGDFLKHQAVGRHVEHRDESE